VRKCFNGVHDDAVKDADAHLYTRAIRKMAGFVARGRRGERRSGSEPVLVQQPAKTVRPLDSVPTFEPAACEVGDRRFEVDGAVRALLVVMGHELPHDALSMAFAANEHPVQALGPSREREPFRKSVCLWRSEGCFDNSGTYRSHHLVKGPDELTVPVTDEEAERSSLVLQVGDQVPRLLGDPRTDWMRRYSRQVDHAAVEVDEEQDIEAPKRGRVDVEEIAG